MIIHGNFYVTPTISGAYSYLWLGFTGTDNLYTDLYGVDNTGNLNFISSDIRFGEGSGRYRIYDVVYGNYNVYWKPFRGSVDLNNVYMQNNYTPAPLPDIVFENYDDSETYRNSLVTGEFTYFYFKVKKNPNWEDVPFPCAFYFHDTTDFEPPNYYFVNDTTSVLINLNEYTGSYTAPNYLYAYSHDNYYYYYALPCTLPLGSYNNNSSYQLDLYYIDTETDESHIQHYNWTTNFTSAGVTKQEENKNDLMLSNINYFRDFFNKSTEINNNSFLNMFPSSSQFLAPTENGINTIFTAFYNAFTNNQTTTFRFTFPFSNEQYIDIRSDLVTSRLPNSILILIQTVYWFFICRFIIKDIAKLSQKAKSGEIFEDNTGNIKTDLL